MSDILLPVDSAFQKCRDADEFARCVESLQLFAHQERIVFYYLDRTERLLWVGDSVEWPVARGVCGHVASTGRSARFGAGTSGEWYDAEVDGAGEAGERAGVTHPIRGLDGEVHAVLSIILQARRRLSNDDEDRIAIVCSVAGYHLSRIRAIERRNDEFLPVPEGSIYRQEAIEAYVRRGDRGELVQSRSRWSGPLFWVALACAVLAIVVADRIEIRTNIHGEAIVWLRDSCSVSASGTKALTSVFVLQGQHVREGQILFRSHLLAEENLQDRIGPTPNELVTGNERWGKATCSGPVISLSREPRSTRIDIEDRLGIQVIAHFPLHVRPRLAAGDEVEFALSGFDDAVFQATVATVGITDDASQTEISFRIPTRTFTSQGKTFRFFDHMSGVATVQTSSRSLFHALVP